MKNNSHSLHWLLIAVMVFLPLRGVMADAGDVVSNLISHTPNHTVTDSEGHNFDSDFDHKVLNTNGCIHMMSQSPDCQGHEKSDCDACVPFFTFKDNVDVRVIYSAQIVNVDYSMPVTALIISNAIRPPII